MTATREPAAETGASVHGSEALRLVGADVEVPLVTGGSRRYVNLDYAASAPALQAVHDAVEELLGWYSSVHRGAGFKSRASTAAYEGARESIRRFVNARDDHAVIITRNTTDSINLLAGTLPRARTSWPSPASTTRTSCRGSGSACATCRCPSRRPRRWRAWRRRSRSCRTARTRTSSR